MKDNENGVDRTVAHGGKVAARRLQDGSQVVVHYTKQGTDETAE